MGSSSQSAIRAYDGAEHRLDQRLRVPAAHAPQRVHGDADANRRAMSGRMSAANGEAADQRALVHDASDSRRRLRREQRPQAGVGGGRVRRLDEK